MLYGLPGLYLSITNWIYMLNFYSEYYRQTPPKVPHFLKTLFRRKLVLWFLASEILRDYWLSGVSKSSFFLFNAHCLMVINLQPYGRNWTFLWSVPIPKWQILILIVVFFVGVWAAMLIVLTHFSKTHTWLLPVFAVGLGAPRWCQVRKDSWDPVDAKQPVDALGDILFGSVHSMGRQRRAIPWHFSLAMARCS